MRKVEPLRPYQQRAVEVIINRRRVAVWLKMGAGKTRIAIEAAKRLSGPVLVLAPNANVVKDVWVRQVGMYWPDAKLVPVLSGRKTPPAALRPDPRAVVVTTYQLARTRELLHAVKWNVMVCDEATRLKNWSAKTTRAVAKAIRKRREMAVIQLTGTPSANTLEHVWAQIYTIRPHAVGPKREFMPRFFNGRQIRVGGGRMITVWEPKLNAASRIAEFLVKRGVVFTTSPDDYNWLPPLVEVVERHDIDSATRRAMSDVLTEGVADVKGAQIIAPDAATRRIKALQLAAGFLYDEKGRAIQLDTQKLDRAFELIEQAGSPTFVVCAFRHCVDQFVERGAMELRSGRVDVIDAWNRGEIPLLVADYRAVSHGIELDRGGDVVLFYNALDDFEAVLQLQGRLLRPQQRRSVTSIDLVADRSVESAIVKTRNAGKRPTQEQLIAAAVEELGRCSTN